MPKKTRSDNGGDDDGDTDDDDGGGGDDGCFQTHGSTRNSLQASGGSSVKVGKARTGFVEAWGLYTQTYLTFPLAGKMTEINAPPVPDSPPAPVSPRTLLHQLISLSPSMASFDPSSLFSSLRRISVCT